MLSSKEALRFMMTAKFIENFKDQRATTKARLLSCKTHHRETSNNRRIALRFHFRNRGKVNFIDVHELFLAYQRDRINAWINNFSAQLKTIEERILNLMEHKLFISCRRQSHSARVWIDGTSSQAQRSRYSTQSSPIDDRYIWAIQETDCASLWLPIREKCSC